MMMGGDCVMRLHALAEPTVYATHGPGNLALWTDGLLAGRYIAAHQSQEDHHGDGLCRGTPKGSPEGSAINDYLVEDHGRTRASRGIRRRGLVPLCRALPRGIPQAAITLRRLEGRTDTRLTFRRRMMRALSQYPAISLTCLVPLEGLEPPRPCEQQILSLSLVRSCRCGPA